MVEGALSRRTPRFRASVAGGYNRLYLASKVVCQGDNPRTPSAAEEGNIRTELPSAAKDRVGKIRSDMHLQTAPERLQQPLQSFFSKGAQHCELEMAYPLDIAYAGHNLG